MTLTEAQHAAVLSQSQRLLVVAGPGSGKSTVLCERVRRMVQDGAHPGAICVITYTHSAARELRERLGSDLQLGFCGTLHAACLRLINDFSGIGPVAVMDEEQATELLAKVVANAGLRKVTKEIKASVAAGPKPGDAGGPRWASNLFFHKMLDSRLFSYDFILHYGLVLLRGTPHGGHVPPPPWPFPWRHLLVDEMQDSSPLDLEIYRAMPVASRFYVGDSDQAVFRFRGACPENVLTLATEMDVVKLEQNFRCDSDICISADTLIGHCAARVPKRTLSATGAEGSIELCLKMPDQAYESTWVCNQLRALKPGETAAVLARTNFLVQQYALILETVCIPVRVKEEKFFPPDWPIVLRALTFAANQTNEDLAYWWVEQSRGKCDAAAARLEALKADVPFITHFYTMAQILGALKLSASAIALLDQAAGQLEPGWEVNELILHVTSSEFGRQERGEGVDVLTMHGSKGREWDCVFIVGCDDSIIPGRATTEQEISDERRLLYVALTRARHRVVLTNVLSRATGPWMKWPAKQEPSRFLGELGI